MNKNYSEMAEELAIWCTGGVLQFSGTTESVIDAWKKEFTKALESVAKERDEEKNRALKAEREATLKVMDDKDSEIESLRLRLERMGLALKNIGNVVGGPVMGYSSAETRLGETNKMLLQAYQIVKQALEDDANLQEGYHK